MNLPLILTVFLFFIHDAKAEVGAKTCGHYQINTASYLQDLEQQGDKHSANKNWEAAAECYRKLIARNPNLAKYHYKYGGALAMMAQASNKFKALSLISDIRDSFEKAISLEPNHIDARHALIELNLQLPAIAGGSEQKAHSYAAELSKISPIDGLLAKGHIAEYYKRFPLAEQHYKSAIDVGKSKTAHQKLANLYKNKMKQPHKAAAVMQQYQKSQTN